LLLADSRKLSLLLGLLYLGFVVYGSLVPFDFRPRSLDAAIRDFTHIRYLNLGIASRADWVANILLYIPLPFLWLAALNRERQFFRQAFFSVFIFIFCVALSIAIEFTQLFFPPRTVSLNDIVAEISGTLIGIVLWWLIGGKIAALVESVFVQGKRAVYAALVLYAAAYLAFSLFPYDFLISTQEIRAKLASGFFHWVPSQGACGGALRCGAKMMAEAIAIAPLGLLLGFTSRKTSWALLRSAAWMGFWFGLLIEILQFFIVSGITMAASVITRIIGMAIGAASGDLLKRTSIWPLLYLLRPLMPVTSIAYVLLLASVTWLHKGPLLSLEDGMRRLYEIRFMPFYYHYYTSESAAMSSLFAVGIMFVPIGVQYWIWRVTQLREFMSRGAITVSGLGAAIATVLEFGKLFLAGARPDPTNVIIGMVASTAGFIAASICTKSSLQVALVEDDGAN
jgi:VanZ family protein